MDVGRVCGAHARDPRTRGAHKARRGSDEKRCGYLAPALAAFARMASCTYCAMPG